MRLVEHKLYAGAAALAVALVLPLVAASPASASVAPTSGAVGLGTGAVPLTIVNVGGGTWDYGVNYRIIAKTVYSNYIHPTKVHSATSICGSATDTDVEAPNVWAITTAKCNILQSTAAYWDVL
ncbi:MAG: lactococcin 972 family bacteriocin [Acidimicrobiales bacterium]